MSIILDVAQRVKAKLGLKVSPISIAKRYPQYDIGRGSYGDLKIVDFGEGEVLQMGAYCSVASGCKVLLGGGHRTDWVTTYPFSVTEESLSHIAGHPTSRGSVIIGNDVWLASDVTVLSGVTICDGAVVMAGSIVTQNVRPYAIVGGVPAREVRRRFDDQTVERLLKVGWWNWSHERIVSAGERLLSQEVEAFLALAEQGKL